MRQKLPDHLQTSLEARLTAFLAAQAEEHWDAAGEFLDKCPGGCRSVLTNHSNACLLLRMEEVRLLDFSFAPSDTFTCLPDQSAETDSAINGAMAEHLQWSIQGVGRFRAGSEEWTQRTRIVAYRDTGQWYFLPPQDGMQSEWEKIHFTDSDFTKDRPYEVRVSNSPSVPLEITDVHVHMERNYPSLHKVTFRIHNRTAMKVIAVGWTLGGTGGGYETRGPYEIAPHGFIDMDDGETVEVDGCEPSPSMPVEELRIQQVYFADGSEWHAKPIPEPQK